MDKEKIIEILKRVISKANYLRGSNEIWLIIDELRYKDIHASPPVLRSDDEMDYKRLSEEYYDLCDIITRDLQEDVIWELYDVIEEVNKI
jgi:hypothetical protein